MENEQTTSTLEVDVKGGWLVTHWTRTWDTRIALTQIDANLDDATAELAKAQEKVNALQADKTQLAQQIADAKAKEAADSASVQASHDALLNG